MIFGGIILFIVIHNHRERGWLYQLALLIFGLYILKVINLVVFPVMIPADWPSSITKEISSNLMSNINFIPFNFIGKYGLWTHNAVPVKTLYWEIGGNLLLTVPFGFGFKFIFNVNKRNIFRWIIGAGLSLELVQLIIFVLIGPSRRVIDITDIILNTAGVLVGYFVFQLMLHVYQRLKHDRTH